MTAVEVLQTFLGTLPEGHTDYQGVRRAIEVLRDEAAAERRRRPVTHYVGRAGTTTVCGKRVVDLPVGERTTQISCADCPVCLAGFGAQGDARAAEVSP